MEIKIEKSLLKVLAIVVIVIVGLFVWLRRTDTSVQSSTTFTAAAPQLQTLSALPSTVTASGLTKENSGGDVTVSVTPTIASETELGFDMAVNTHTVDMSAFDPKKQIILIGANGKEIVSRNLTVEGSGHHQQFQMTFPKVEKPWKLVVRNVGGMPVREFSW